MFDMVGTKPVGVEKVTVISTRKGDRSVVRIPREQLLEAAQVSHTVRQYVEELEQQNTYGDVVTDEMAVACGKVARLVLNGTETARNTR